MRLLWLTDDYLPHMGGSRVVYHNVCRKIGGDSLCLITRWIEGCGKFDTEAGYRIRRVHFPVPTFSSKHGIEEFSLFLPLLLAASSEARRGRPDVIHCGEPLASGLIGYLMRKMYRIPYIIWLHDNPFGPVSRLRHPLRKFLCLRADGIITCCNYSRDAIMREGYPESRIQLVNPSVDTSVFRPSDEGERVRERLGLKGKKVLLTISRLLPHKGQDMVIRALPELIKLHPDLVYLIGGTGPHRQPLEGLARALGVGERVIFTGSLRQDEIADYYNACDLFIMLNREVGGLSWEGFGIVFIEASACGKPVIGGRAGGVMDSILDGRTGLLADPLDIQGIVKSVHRLIADEELSRRMGAAGLEWAQSGFSWEDRAHKTLAFSERILSRALTGRGVCDVKA